MLIQPSSRPPLLFVFLLALLALVTSITPLPLAAAVIQVSNGDVPALIAAINTANASPGADMISLARGGLYTLTQADHTIDTGATGLPRITSQIRIEGNGATIQRSPAANTPFFRIMHVASKGDLTLQRVTLRGGHSEVDTGAGGGLLVARDSHVTLDQSVVAESWAGFFGGGIANDGVLVIQNGSVIRNNEARDGGGISNGFYGELYVNDSTITSNTGNFGGGIFTDNGGLTFIERSLIRDNLGRGWGGGILSLSFGGNADFGTVLEVHNSTIINNVAGEGGGIYHNTGRAAISHSTFVGNRSNSNGGGLYSRDQFGHVGPVMVTNSTFSDNDAANLGGGLYLQRMPILRFVTVVGNRAGSGGGLYYEGQGLNLASSIVAQNTPRDCAGGTILSQGYNLATDQSCSLTAVGDMPNTSPLLGPLADNGGTTATHALLTGSPALDRTPQGVNGCGTTLTDDQRGIRRPQGEACDSGAFEFMVNLLHNPGFESGVWGWTFYTNGAGVLSNDSPGYQGVASGRIDIDAAGSNVQLYQTGFTLEPNSRYRLQFAAKANTGHDLSVYLHRDSSPYTSYGVSNFRVNLTPTWKTFTIEFTTKRFTAPISDTRLRFWLAPFDATGDVYWFDQLSLQKVTPAATATAAMSAVAGSVAGRVDGVQVPVTITLVDLESEGAVDQSMTTTDAAGAFRFEGVPAGTYELRVAPPTSYIAPEPVQLAVSDEPNEELLFLVEANMSTIFLPLVSR